jgi:hypothetical protein
MVKIGGFDLSKEAAVVAVISHSPLEQAKSSTFAWCRYTGDQTGPAWNRRYKVDFRTASILEIGGRSSMYCNQ